MNGHLILDNSWEHLDKLILFGYGRQAKKLLPKLEEDFSVIAVIDNDKKKHGQHIHGSLYISSITSVKEELKNSKTIVCAMGSNYLQIRDQLTSTGLQEGINFIQHEIFISQYYSRFTKKVYLLKTDVFVTSYCNLNCEKCASFIPYWKNKQHINFENIVETIKLFFEHIEYVFSMDIFGGEPLLYPYLSELIAFIGGNYRDKIGYLGIITNGLVKLSDNLIDMAKQYDCQFSVSDYSSELDCVTEVDRFCSVLNDNEIGFIRNRDMQWKDLGFPKNIKIRTPEQARAHRLLCNSTCHVLNNRRLYFCAAGLAVQMCMGGGLSKIGDYFSLDHNEEAFSVDRLIEFINGKTNASYQGACSVCDGYGPDNCKNVKAAIQLLRTCIPEE